MAITPSQLRSDVYRLLDQVISTGRPIQVKRKGKLLKIVSVHSGKKMDKLIKRRTMCVQPEKIVHQDWSKYWKTKYL